MPKKAPFQDLALRPPGKGVPLFRWFYDELRDAITSGRLKPGARLPSTRNLSRQYGVARGTVLGTFEQLLAEGYVESRVGSGTYVAGNLPDRFLASSAVEAEPIALRAGGAKVAGLSKWSAKLSRPFPLLSPHEVGRPFQPNQPALDLFPSALWGQIAGRRLRRASASLLNGVDSAGYRPLREAIAVYLGSARGVRCTADQVVVTTGTQQVLDLTARLLLNPADCAWMEDPGYSGAVAALESAGAKVIPIPVDESGFDVAKGLRRAPSARLAYTTPAHEFPLGVSLSLERRMALLRWAHEAGAWIIEDDYDSEYRFVGRPLAALQGLDTAGCVIFTGSFNKTLFPGLRLGYAVLPERLVEPFCRARSLGDRFSPALDQAVLCDFIVEGHFGQHIRRMRQAYGERLGALLEAAKGPLAGLLNIVPIQAGMQTVGYLDTSLPDCEIEAAAEKEGITVMALSAFQIRRRDINGLVLGFASAPPAAIREGAERLSCVIRQWIRRKG